MGLYDRVESVFGQIEDSEESEENKKCKDKLIKTSQKYLKGLEAFYKIFHEVTEKVCQSLCLNFADNTCNAVIYNLKKKKCYITRITKDTTDATLIDSNVTNYYERERCNGEQFSKIIVLKQLKIGFFTKFRQTYE